MVSPNFEIDLFENHPLPGNPELNIDIEIGIIRADPGCAAQKVHQDDPTNEICPTRFHICVPTSPLDAENSIQYIIPNSQLTADLILNLGEVAIHSGSVDHRGLRNSKDADRTNVFVSAHPSNLAVTFEL